MNGERGPVESMNMRKHVNKMSSMALAGILLFALMIVPVSLRGDLDDFKKGTENSGERWSGGNGSWDRDGMDDSGDSNATCWPGLIWMSLNAPVHYTRFPYSEPGDANFIVREKPGKAGIEVEPADGNPVRDENPDAPRPKKWFATTEAGGQSLGGEGDGFFGAIHGRLRSLAGPLVEYRQVYDGEDRLHLLAAGIAFPLFQLSGFMPDFYVQWVGMRGLLTLDGVAYGIIVNSYPWRGWTGYFRIGRHEYYRHKLTFEFLELEARIGHMIGRCELFAGYRWFRTEHAELKGPLAGIRSHF